MAHESGLNCIHTESGLCPACLVEYAADPSAWLEYGRHARGIANWRALQEEIAAQAGGAQPSSYDGIPF